MGKNKRKKKQREADFKKVKLKVGKKLPKGTNETQTSFKSQGIVVPSQDLTKEGQLTNTRRQGLKDLLSHLSHYSATVRQDALKGLKSLFHQHSHIFHENISSILGPIAAKMTDTDSDVRHSLQLLLCFILPHLPPDQAAPFLPILVAHLSCAMSHIYEDIQLESLEFFSLFLKCFPKQISENSTQLLDNFIGLISQHSGGTTNIAVNPKGKLSSPKTRLKILTQIYDFLKALYVEDITTHTQLDLTTGASPCSWFSQTKLTCKSVHYGNGKEPSICLFAFGVKMITQENIGQNQRGNTNELDYNSDVKEFMQKIIPLLLQFWIECNPSLLCTSLPDNALPAVNLSIMLNVMNILKVLLHKLINTKEENGDSVSLRNWLVSLYFKDFNTHFLKLFPFQNTSNSKGKRKAKVPEASSDNVAMTLNISICEVMSFFVGTSSVSAKQASKNWMGQLEDFIVESLGFTYSDKVSGDQLKSVLIYVEKVLQDASDQEECNSAERILSALYKLYQSSHLLSGVKNILLKFFATLIVRRQKLSISTHLSWQAPLKQWILTLPKLLVQLKTSSQEMTPTVLKVLASLMKQKTVDVDEAELQKQLNCFLDPTSGAFCKLSRDTQNTTIELFFSLPIINTCLLQTLALCSHQQAVPAEVVKYLMQVLHYRSPANSGYLDKPSAFDLSSYLSFLFSVAIGYTRKELHNLQTSNGDTVLSSHTLVEDADMEKRWNRNQDILQAVCTIYAQFQHADQLLHLMEPVLEKTLNESKVLPLTVAGGLLQLCKCFSLLANIPESSTKDGDDQAFLLTPSLVSHLAELSFECVLHTTKNDDTMNSNLDIMNCLFSDVIQLLTVQPAILERLLDIFYSKTSDVQSYCHKITMMTAKLLQSFGKQDNTMFYSEAVGRLVDNIVEKLRSRENQGSYFSDLDYQCSMFRIEVNRRKAIEIK